MLVEFIEVRDRGLVKVFLNPKHIVCVEPTHKPGLLEQVDGEINSVVEFSSVTISAEGQRGLSEKKVLVGSCETIRDKVNRSSMLLRG